MDPLSVSAGVVGLLTAAIQVSTVLGDLIQRTRKAPKECRDLKREVDDIHIVLSQLQQFVLGAATVSKSRTSLILVDQVVATLASCVTTFSDLDVFVESLDSDEKMGLMDRLRWLAKTKEVNKIIAQLQMHKGSMTLMMVILTSQSSLQVESSVDKLCDLVNNLLRENAELAGRLQSIEPGATVGNSTAPASEAHLVETSGAELESDNREIESQQHNEESPDRQHTSKIVDDMPASDAVEDAIHSQLDRPQVANPATVTTQLENESKIIVNGIQPQLHGKEDASSSVSVKRKIRGFAFEELLSNSRVYRMASRHNEDSFSVLSSAGRTGSWSMLSGLSLSEMSNIAILALPIYATDLANREIYDFNIPTTESPLIVPVSSVPDMEKGMTSRKAIFDRFQRLSVLRKGAKADLSSPGSNDQVLPTVFGVNLVESVQYARAEIASIGEHGLTQIYGYIPLIVAQCAYFIKKAGVTTDGIYLKAGHPLRVKQLQTIFDNPPGYGKAFYWTGYTVHDAVAVMLRFLKSLPEPLVPTSKYEEFVSVLRTYMDDLEYAEARSRLEQSKEVISSRFEAAIMGLPTANRHLLVYLVDLLSTTASFIDGHLMTAERLVAVFQPGLIWRPDASDYNLANAVIIYLIQHVDDDLLSILFRAEGAEITVDTSKIDTRFP